MKTFMVTAGIIALLSLPSVVIAADSGGYITPQPKNISIPKLETFIAQYHGEPEVFRMKHSKYTFIEVFKTPVRGPDRCPPGKNPDVPCAYEYILVFNHYSGRYRCPDHEADSGYIPVALGVLGQITSVQVMDEGNSGNFPVNTESLWKEFGSNAIVIKGQNFSDAFLVSNPEVSKKVYRYALEPKLDPNDPCSLEWGMLKAIMEWQEVLDAYGAFTRKPDEAGADHAINILRAKAMTDDDEERAAFKKIQNNLAPLVKRIGPKNKASVELAFEFVRLMDAAQMNDLVLTLGLLIKSDPVLFLNTYDNYAFRMKKDKGKAIREALLTRLGAEFDTPGKQCVELQARIAALSGLPDARYRLQKYGPLQTLRKAEEGVCPEKQKPPADKGYI